MNCKPGDLARYVGRDPKCYGYVVTCIALDPRGHRALGELCWVVDPPLPAEDGMVRCLGVADSALRPIRDQPGEDEILRIAGKPRREENVNFPPNVFTISID